MILMQKLRQAKGCSQRQLWRLSGIDPHYLSAAERQGMRLYPKQAERIAEALDWKGDPMQLFEEIGDKR